jgi:predicted transcriptional regulator
VRYRSRADIISEILKIADNGTSKTKIMYGAYLSYVQLKDYMKVLLENGLLAYDERKLQYRTTEKGRMFLKTYDKVDLILEIGKANSSRLPHYSAMALPPKLNSRAIARLCVPVRKGTSLPMILTSLRYSGYEKQNV